MTETATPPVGKSTPRRGGARERLLDLAEAAVLEKGFAGTSIEELIAGVGITKSGFFYHFPDKNALAKALLERYLARDFEILEDVFTRAEELDEDPLHSYLVALKMLAEVFADLPSGHPGCLVAAYTYQDQLFNRDVRALNYEGVLSLRARFREKLDRIAAHYPPKIAVDLDHLADMPSALVDGGIILSKALKDPNLLPQQILLYRDFVKLVFQR